MVPVNSHQGWEVWGALKALLLEEFQVSALFLDQALIARGQEQVLLLGQRMPKPASLPQE